VLAETCVFGKQLHGFFSCGPAATLQFCLPLNLRFGDIGSATHTGVASSNPALKSHLTWNWNIAAGQTLSLSYGRYIAEFLNEESLVHLGLLDLSTCVGLRYGRLRT